ncbi:Undecaprenyl-phosphate mannosyltransferase [Methylacidimicrobium cyclopophantes]|uniref:Undecaprenyl-phosphate mannosyltransferase n=1 Tax=Methylacidimicrobium cyclopophantes TaxID=1041766 RepID=A0A5E6M7B5_9BACT|nr:glycosyltransferase family 2 protein [Methylacidimicrobium cyclopophantes]VVM04821.1 Undecaprenyl-phosphate mannosyltransferase [Methylacidimicrobium cyclopophantes]
MTTPRTRALVLIPSYNTGPKLLETVEEARRFWEPVWVVIDGSRDGSELPLRRRAEEDPGLRLFSLSANQGKGAAIHHGLREAARLGFTHALTMDADGQHPASLIPRFLAASAASPDAMVLGCPIFDESAPSLRVGGRKISNWLARIETLGGNPGDVLFGFRVYPIRPLLEILESRRTMRRFDFDPEAAVRLFWKGVDPVHLPAPVRYLSRKEGGVSQFRYLRDNLLLARMHLRLLLGALARLFLRHR